jgi:hypothetical protein
MFKSPARRIGMQLARAVFVLSQLGFGAALAADEPDVTAAAPLLARYVALREQLERNAFQQPLYLDSSETPGVVRGDVYAVTATPFDKAGAVLGSAGDWCQILMLHVNNKDCRVSKSGAGTVLTLWIGARYDQPLADASRLDFAHSVVIQTPRYLEVRLSADEGPIGTRDYRIELEAVPLPNGRTFVHLGYSYGYGMLGRLAMQAYLATTGKGKVGFTVLGVQADDQPRYVAGLRGVVERNTMRYYLAIDAFLGALSTEPQARFEKRIRDWYRAAERYPRQLHEMEAEAYLEMKRRENGRPPAGPVS